MRCFSLLVFAVFNTILPLSLNATEASEQNLPTVGVSIRPIGLLVDTLAADLVKVEVLLDAGVSPHHTSLKPSQIQKLNRADLCIWVGPNFEPWLSKPLAKKAKGGLSQVLTLSDISGLTLLARGEAHSHKHEHGDINPHIWLDPENAKVIVKQIYRELSVLLPEKEPILAARLGRVLEKLTREQLLARERHSGGKARFVSFHSGLSYYVSAYKLDQVDVLVDSEDHAPSLQKIARLKKQMQEGAGLDCLLADISELAAARRYAKLLGLPVIEVDLLGARKSASDWFAYKREISEAILNCRSEA